MFREVELGFGGFVLLGGLWHCVVSDRFVHITMLLIVGLLALWMNVLREYGVLGCRSTCSDFGV